MPAAFKSREDLAMSHASLYSINVFQTLNNAFVLLSAHSFLSVTCSRGMGNSDTSNASF
jgi:hypothetical protein